MIISTPAKIILSGEHSVDYGAPAIGAPLSLFLYSRWTAHKDKPGLTLNFKGEEVELAPSWQALAGKLASFRDNYEKFRQGKLQIRDVLPEKHDLVTLVFAAFYDRFGGTLPGLSLRLDTEIPMSSGLGSSSSLILNLLQGLLRLAGREVAHSELHDFARGIEDFQHGTSSGIDLALVAARQPVMFIRGRGVVKSMPPIPSGIVLVNTGRPEVSTGQCVAQVRERFAGSAIWDEFAACTRKIEAAFAGEDNKALREGIAENQHLLNTIGVVPPRVQSFVTRCLANGIAAKVCGAGAVAGEAAGMLWALADNDDTMRLLEDSAREYGYTHGLYSVAS